MNSIRITLPQTKSSLYLKQWLLSSRILSTPIKGNLYGCGRQGGKKVKVVKRENFRILPEFSLFSLLFLNFLDFFLIFSTFSSFSRLSLLFLHFFFIFLIFSTFSKISHTFTKFINTLLDFMMMMR